MYDLRWPNDYNGLDSADHPTEREVWFRQMGAIDWHGGTNLTLAFAFHSSNAWGLSLIHLPGTPITEVFQPPLWLSDALRSEAQADDDAS